MLCNKRVSDVAVYVNCCAHVHRIRDVVYGAPCLLHTDSVARTSAVTMGDVSTMIGKYSVKKTICACVAGRGSRMPPITPRRLGPPAYAEGGQRYQAAIFTRRRA